MKTTSYAAALLAALCFSTTVLAAVPVGAASDPTNAVSASASSNNEAASSSDKSDDTAASETSESSKTSDSTSTEASTSTDTDEPAKGATTDTEADVTQTIEIHQVISKTATKAASVADTKYTGVNGATWSVYDVTSELTSLLSGQKDAKDLKSATDQLESALTKKNLTMYRSTTRSRPARQRPSIMLMVFLMFRLRPRHTHTKPCYSKTMRCLHTPQSLANLF